MHSSRKFRSCSKIFFHILEDSKELDDLLYQETTVPIPISNDPDSKDMILFLQMILSDKQRITLDQAY